MKKMTISSTIEERFMKEVSSRYDDIMNKKVVGLDEKKILELLE